MNSEQDISFVRLARRFFRSDLWNESREFSRAEAWLDMIATASIAPERKAVCGYSIDLQRGDLIGSLRYLARRWSWSKGKVERFLHTLRDEGRVQLVNSFQCGTCNPVEYASDTQAPQNSVVARVGHQTGHLQTQVAGHPNGTPPNIVRLLKYDTYNRAPCVSGTPQWDTKRDTNRDTKRDKKKEVQKEVKNREGDASHPVRPRFVKPSAEELNLYAAKIGLSTSEVERFVNYYESNGWRVGRNPMRSWQHAMVNWKLRGEERNGQQRTTANAYALKTQAQAIEDLLRQIRSRGVEDAFGWRAANEEDRKKHRELRLKLKELREKMAAMES